MWRWCVQRGRPDNGVGAAQVEIIGHSGRMSELGCLCRPRRSAARIQAGFRRSIGGVRRQATDRLIEVLARSRKRVGLQRNTRTMQGETRWTMTSKSLNASTIASTRGHRRRADRAHRCRLGQRYGWWPRPWPRGGPRVLDAPMDHGQSARRACGLSSNGGWRDHRRSPAVRPRSRSKPLQGQTHGLKDKTVGHVFRLREGKVARFDIEDAV